MLDELFSFPIIMVDVENEEKKQQNKDLLGLPVKEEEEQDYDIVYGKAEYPYYDFIGLEDRWLPQKESLTKAMSGEFDACIVKFANVAPLLVPWSRTRFKKEMKKFYDVVQQKKKEDEKGMTIIKITPEQLAQIMDSQPQSPKDE